MLKISFSNTANPEPAKFYFGLASVLLISSGLFLAVIQPGDVYTDGGIFTAVALKDLSGGTLYVDAWENKPPAIFYLLELFMLAIPEPVYAVFTMAFAAFMATSLSLYILIQKYLKSIMASVLFTAITLYFTLFRNNIGDGLYTEIYGTLCILISLVFMERYAENGKSSFALASAFSLGLAAWFKEPFLLMCLPVLLIHFKILKTRRLRFKYVISAAAPGILIIMLLFVQGALPAFIASIEYNFGYLQPENAVSAATKRNDYYLNLISPVKGLMLLFCLLVYRNLKHIKTQADMLLYLLLLASSTVFVFMSPYNFGHYYYPSFVLLFVVIAKSFQLHASNRPDSFGLIIILMCLYTIYRIDQEYRPQFTFKIRPYQANRIGAFLKKQKGKTLFSDYVVRSDVYIKTGLMYPTFLPVALPVHFSETPEGLKNRERIWRELSTNPPDFLLTTYTTSYFSWYLPETDFYTKNYEKADSFQESGKEILYLWKRRSIR